MYKYDDNYGNEGNPSCAIEKGFYGSLNRGFIDGDEWAAGRRKWDEDNTKLGLDDGRTFAIRKFDENGRPKSGTMTYNSDDSRRHYVGHFQNGQPCVRGTLTYKNGNTFKGEYDENGEPSNGTLTYPVPEENMLMAAITGITTQVAYYTGYGRTPSRYVGPLRNGEPHGEEQQGTMTYTDGTEDTGEWRNGVLQDDDEPEASDDDDSRRRLEELSRNPLIARLLREESRAASPRQESPRDPDQLS